MKPQGKYVALLERELESYKALLAQARKDIEFYRAKLERLELALSKEKVFAYDLTTEAKPSITETRLNRMPSGRMPWHEVQRQWNALSEADQQKAIEQGWVVEEKKEESNEGKQHV